MYRFYNDLWLLGIGALLMAVSTISAKRKRRYECTLFEFSACLFGSLLCFISLTGWIEPDPMNTLATTFFIVRFIMIGLIIAAVVVTVLAGLFMLFLRVFESITGTNVFVSCKRRKHEEKEEDAEEDILE